MSDLAQDRERYANSHWHWDKPTAVRILKGLLADLEAGSDQAKLLALPGLGKDGIPTLWFCTEDREVYGKGFNQSTFCPPFCG